MIPVKVMDGGRRARCPLFYAPKEVGGLPEHYLAVDVSDVLAKFNEIKLTIVNRDMQNKIMHDTLVDTAKYVKTILAKTIPQQYAVKQAFVRAGVKKYIDQSSGNINIAVPLSGHRGVIGGTFQKRGKVGRPKKGQRKISAKILKGKWSKLPDKMDHQGGNPPFVAGNGVVFTRKYKTSSHPIVRVAGLGLPQMPLNQSKDEVEDAIVRKMSERLDHHFHRYLGV